jgi:broad specificity phosphatase PhoE
MSRRGGIVLVRHGRPDCDRPARLDRDGFVAWLGRYRVARVTERAPAGVEAAVVLSSGLARAIDSAALLAPSVAAKAEPLFDEVETAVPAVGLTLPLAAWLGLARVAWMGGAYSMEPVGVAGRRAERAAERLLAAAVAGDVVMVGHGWMNRMIARALARRGLRRRETNGSAYWGQIRMG